MSNNQNNCLVVLLAGMCLFSANASAGLIIDRLEVVASATATIKVGSELIEGTTGRRSSQTISSPAFGELSQSARDRAVDSTEAAGISNVALAHTNSSQSDGRTTLAGNLELGVDSFVNASEPVGFFAQMQGEFDYWFTLDTEHDYSFHVDSFIGKDPTADFQDFDFALFTLTDGAEGCRGRLTRFQPASGHCQLNSNLLAEVFSVDGFSGTLAPGSYRLRAEGRYISDEEEPSYSLQPPAHDLMNLSVFLTLDDQSVDNGQNDVPEPTSLYLLLMGLGLLGHRRNYS